MSDLVEFYRARLAEDEQAAREATPGPWAWRERLFGAKTFHSLVSDRPAAPGEVGWDVLLPDVVIPSAISDAYPSAPNAEHIARHDPARVLREVAAKRRIVATFVALDTHPNRLTYAHMQQQWVALRAVIAALALPDADHPDYREEWSVT